MGEVVPIRAGLGVGRGRLKGRGREGALFILLVESVGDGLGRAPWLLLVHAVPCHARLPHGAGAAGAALQAAPAGGSLQKSRPPRPLHTCRRSPFKL